MVGKYYALHEHLLLDEQRSSSKIKIVFTILQGVTAYSSFQKPSSPQFFQLTLVAKLGTICYNHFIGKRKDNLGSMLGLGLNLNISLSMENPHLGDDLCSELVHM